MTSAPEEMYEKQGLTSDDPLCEIFRKRSNNYTRGLLADRKMMESVVPYFEMEDGVLTKLELLPVALGVEEPRYRNGNPKFAPDRGIIERLRDISAPYGTKITIDERGYGIVEL
jgi:poly-gamma-glutamate synthesis protein (capsule biosynthesis protein)